MTKKELVEQRKALIAEIDNADEKRLAEIETELKRNALKIAEIEAEERDNAADEQAATEERAARPAPCNAAYRHRLVEVKPLVARHLNAKCKGHILDVAAVNRAA